jgi:hypothetical protein
MYLFLLPGDPESPRVAAYEVGKPDAPLTIEAILDELLQMVADRNPDFYEYADGKLLRAR